MKIFERLIWKLGKRYFVARIEKVLHGASQARVINNMQRHELDARLKYYPDRAW